MTISILDDSNNDVNTISILDLAKGYIDDPNNVVKTITDINFYNDDLYSVYNNNIVLGGTGRNNVVIGTSNIDTDVKLYVEGDIVVSGTIKNTLNVQIVPIGNINVDIYNITR